MDTVMSHCPVMLRRRLEIDDGMDAWPVFKTKGESLVFAHDGGPSDIRPGPIAGLWAFDYLDTGSYCWDDHYGRAGPSERASSCAAFNTLIHSAL